MAITNVPRILIPCLDAKMRDAEATNESLALAAGVSQKSVAYSRLGKKIMLTTGLNILEALNTRTFKYSKRGPKS